MLVPAPCARVSVPFNIEIGGEGVWLLAYYNVHTSCLKMQGRKNTNADPLQGEHRVQSKCWGEPNIEISVRSIGCGSGRVGGKIGPQKKI